MNKLPNVYYRAASAAYVCIFIFAFSILGVIDNTPYFSNLIDSTIGVVAFVIGAWQHALRYKYNPKEGE